MITTAVHRAYQFGSFHLDARERRLSRGGEVIPLRLKVFDTLVVLVENAGRLVTKQELLDAVWPETTVEENNLNHNVSVLRKALGERATGQQYIETVPRVGFDSPRPLKPSLRRHTPRHRHRHQLPPRVRKFATARPATVSGLPTRRPAAGRRSSRRRTGSHIWISNGAARSGAIGTPSCRDIISSFATTSAATACRSAT